MKIEGWMLKRRGRGREWCDFYGVFVCFDGVLKRGRMVKFRERKLCEWLWRKVEEKRRERGI